MTPQEEDLIRRAVAARARRRAAREQLLAIKDTYEAVPVRITAQHDWSRAKAALVVAGANAAVQVLVRVFL